MWNLKSNKERNMVERHELESLKDRVKKLEPENDGCVSILLQLICMVAGAACLIWLIQDYKEVRQNLKAVQEQVNEQKKEKQ
jgi:hypothetical protein